MKRVLLSVLIIFVLGLFYYNYKINTPVSQISEDVSFVVESGDGVKKISKNLYEAKLIKSKLFFEFYIWNNKLATKLKAGEYVLSPNLSIKQIVKVLSVGISYGEEQTIKIIEGWNSKEIGEYFEQEGISSTSDFLDLVGYPKVDYRENKKLAKPFDYSDDYDFLKDKPSYRGLEGYLFPDTYRIFKNSDLDTITRKMLDNFDAKLTDEMRADIKKQGKTIYEIVTMASIVQKEVRSEKDMKIVAGIFWDRIKYGQALESCATLAYVLGVNKKQYTYEDTEIDSPYNCYENLGLPPGPIANPGIEAIRATIYPEYTDYNYFLSSSDTGETIYSVTYDEHVRNKAKYIK